MSSRRSLVHGLIVCTAVAVLISVQMASVRAQQGQAQGQGQQALSGANSETGPTATAVPIREAPMIDGLLTERVWQEAPPLTGFTQSDPFEGEPASERTEVRIAYDDEAIYVGVMLHDSDPSQIVTTDTRRDANLNEMDSFQIIFDTYGDRQNGFVFGTNALGVQYDAQVQRDKFHFFGSYEYERERQTFTYGSGSRIRIRTSRTRRGCCSSDSARRSRAFHSDGPRSHGVSWRFFGPCLASTANQPSSGP